MTDVLEAELASQGSLRSGWIDVGENSRFRYIWCLFFYMGFILPFGFMSYWTHTIAIGEYNMDKYLVATMWMVAQIPFFLRPVWAQPVERMQSFSFGRRRSWMLFGSIGHAILFVPLAFIDLEAQPWLFIGVIVVCMIPRLFAEQAVAGMMAESIPDLGRFNSMINFAWRGGGTILIMLMGWFVAAETKSPFYKDGELDFGMIQIIAVCIALIAAISGIAMTFLMKEGQSLRGPNSGKKMRVAKDLKSAIDDVNLQFPENTSISQKILAAMRSQTSWLVLLCCFLLPLGDGFETWFINYQKEILGFSAADITLWSNVFIISKYLGVLGPWLSDIYGRSRMLRLYAIGSIVCYLGLAVLMAIGAPALPILILWMPTLFLTDWMMYTFITVWAEVSDPRLGPTHMSLYQTTHAVSATFIMVGLGGILLFVTDDSYALLFAAAAIGPLIGLRYFSKFKLEAGEEVEDRIDLADKIRELQNKLSRLPWGVDPVDNSSRRRLAISTGIVGILLSAALFAGPMVLLKWETKETQENWDLLGWNDTMITFETANTISTGGSVLATIEVPTTEGGVFSGYLSVELENHNCPGVGEPVWTVSFSMPDRGNFSDGANESSFVAEDWDGEMSISFDARANNLTGFPSEEALLVRLDQITREIWWGHGRGTWTLRVEMTDTNCNGGLFFAHQASFRINVTAQHLIIPSTNPDDGMVSVLSTTDTSSYNFGGAIGVLLGFPILVATPVLAWIGGRDPDSILV
mgnify:CR=1 FL=1